MCSDLDLRDMTLVQGHDAPLCHGQQLCEILSRSNMAVRSYGPDMDFDYVCSDLDLRDMTLIQDYDTLLGHGKHLCKIYRSEKGVWTDRQNNRVIPTLIQGQDTHPLAMVNICVDIIQKGVRSYDLDKMWTDRQPDFQYGILQRTSHQRSHALAD